MIGRDTIAKAASEVAEHLHIIENIRALQTGQKELADAIVAIRDQVGSLPADMRVLRAETKFEALKETPIIVNAVHGGLNQRLETLSNKIALIERGMTEARGLRTLSGPDDAHP